MQRAYCFLFKLYAILFHIDTIMRMLDLEHQRDINTTMNIN